MIRSSKKRTALLEELRRSKEHPTAEMLYNRLKSEYSDLSLGTVYRNLAMFRSSGEVISVGVVNGQERFDGDLHPHSHFICNTCGAVIDSEAAPDFELVTRSAEHLGAEVSRCELVMFGRCRECKNVSDGKNL